MEKKNQKNLYRWKGQYLKRYLTFLLATAIAFTSIPLDTIWADEPEYSEHPGGEEVVLDDSVEEGDPGDLDVDISHIIAEDGSKATITVSAMPSETGEESGVTKVNRVELYEDGETKKGNREDGNWHFAVKDNGTYSFIVYYSSRDEEEIPDASPSEAEKVEPGTEAEPPSAEVETTEAETTEAETTVEDETGSTEEETREELTEPETEVPEPEESTDSTEEDNKEEVEETEDPSQDSTIGLDGGSEDSSNSQDNNSGSEVDNESNSDGYDSSLSEVGENEDNGAESQGTESIALNVIDFFFPVIEAYANDNIFEKAITVEYEITDLLPAGMPEDIDMNFETNPTEEGTKIILSASPSESGIKNGVSQITNIEIVDHKASEESSAIEADDRIAEGIEYRSSETTSEGYEFFVRKNGLYTFLVQYERASDLMEDGGSESTVLQFRTTYEVNSVMRSMGQDTLKIKVSSESGTIYHDESNVKKYTGVMDMNYSTEDLEEPFPSIATPVQQLYYELSGGNADTMQYPMAEFEFKSDGDDFVNPINNMAGIAVERDLEKVSTGLRLRYTTNQTSYRYLTYEEAEKPGIPGGTVGIYSPENYAFFVPKLKYDEYLTSAVLEFGTLKIPKKQAYNIRPLFHSDGSIRPNIVRLYGERSLSPLEYSFTYADGLTPDNISPSATKLVCKAYREYNYWPKFQWTHNVPETIHTGETFAFSLKSVTDETLGIRRDVSRYVWWLNTGRYEWPFVGGPWDQLFYVEAEKGFELSGKISDIDKTIYDLELVERRELKDRGTVLFTFRASGISSFMLKKGYWTSSEKSKEYELMMRAEVTPEAAVGKHDKIIHAAGTTYDVFNEKYFSAADWCKKQKILFHQQEDFPEYWNIDAETTYRYGESGMSTEVAVSADSYLLAGIEGETRGHDTVAFKSEKKDNLVVTGIIRNTGTQDLKDYKVDFYFPPKMGTCIPDEDSSETGKESGFGLHLREAPTIYEKNGREAEYTVQYFCGDTEYSVFPIEQSDEITKVSIMWKEFSPELFYNVDFKLAAYNSELPLETAKYLSYVGISSQHEEGSLTYGRVASFQFEYTPVYNIKYIYDPGDIKLVEGYPTMVEPGAELSFDYTCVYPNLNKIKDCELSITMGGKPCIFKEGWRWDQNNKVNIAKVTGDVVVTIKAPKVYSITYQVERDKIVVGGISPKFVIEGKTSRFFFYYFTDYIEETETTVTMSGKPIEFELKKSVHGPKVTRTGFLPEALGDFVVTIREKKSVPITPVDPKTAAYRVEHYKQQLDGSYQLADTDFPLYGELGQTVSATTKEYDHYHLNDAAPGSELSGEVILPSEENGELKLLTLKAYYDLDTYTVTYDLNEGTADGTDYSSQTVKYDENVTVKAAPSRSGYRFDGWRIGTAGYQPGEIISVQNDITLVAQWIKEVNPEPSEKVTITYQWASTDNPDDVNVPGEDTIKKGTVYTAKSQPSTSQKFTFSGWYTDKACTTKYVNGTVLDIDTILYGKWVKDHEKHEGGSGGGSDGGSDGGGESDGGKSNVVIAERDTPNSAAYDFWPIENTAAIPEVDIPLTLRLPKTGDSSNGINAIIGYTVTLVDGTKPLSQEEPLVGRQSGGTANAETGQADWKKCILHIILLIITALEGIFFLFKSKRDNRLLKKLRKELEEGE